MAMYREQNVQPFGVNPASVPSHERYVTKFQFTFPLLSDPERVVSRAYGVLKPDGKGIQRSVVLIHREGTVVFARRGAPGPDESLRGLDDRDQT
jgi:peroxiredoxin Q/BCP